MEIVFATNNKHKLEEIQKLLPASVKVIGLSDIAPGIDIHETADTLEGNALIKANYVFKNYGLACFSDDTGLEVESLEGRPGVYSARYAGPNCNAADNIEKILKEMIGMGNRKARFRTVIAYVNEEGSQTFEGIVEGEIANELHGAGGFGYDPVFIPEGHSRSFAEMTMQEKNSISHRGRAIEKFIKSVFSA